MSQAEPDLHKLDQKYYDIVLLGKTGMGKSTTGNKLLEIDSPDYSQSDFHRFSSDLVYLRDGGEKRFPVSGDTDHIGQDCHSAVGSMHDPTVVPIGTDELEKDNLVCNQLPCPATTSSFGKSKELRLTSELRTPSTEAKQSHILTVAANAPPDVHEWVTQSGALAAKEDAKTPNPLPEPATSESEQATSGQNNATANETGREANEPKRMHENVSSLTTSKLCELISNERSKVRILDVPSFSDTGEMSHTSCYPQPVYQQNLGIVRSLVRIQIALKLRVKCLLYFLPVRGILEKADGALQEELESLHHFFGDRVFEFMVVAATQYPNKRHQDLGYDEVDIELTKKAFKRALQSIANVTHCPPVVFISTECDGKTILQRIKSELHGNQEFPLEIQDNTCANCSCTIRYGPRNVQIGVVNKQAEDGGNLVELQQGMCHPVFIPASTARSKMFAQTMEARKLANLVPLLPQLARCIHTRSGMQERLLNYMMSDELCAYCNKCPGSEGCCPVNQKVTVELKTGSKTMTPMHDHRVHSVLTQKEQDIN